MSNFKRSKAYVDIRNNVCALALCKFKVQIVLSHKKYRNYFVFSNSSHFSSHLTCSIWNDSNLLFLGCYIDRVKVNHWIYTRVIYFNVSFAWAFCIFISLSFANRTEKKHTKIFYFRIHLHWIISHKIQHHTRRNKTRNTVVIYNNKNERTPY